MQIGRRKGCDLLWCATSDWQCEDSRFTSMVGALIADAQLRSVKGDDVIVVVPRGGTCVDDRAISRRQVVAAQAAPAFGPATDVVNERLSIMCPVRGFKGFCRTIKHLKPASGDIQHFQ